MVSVQETGETELFSVTQTRDFNKETIFKKQGYKFFPARLSDVVAALIHNVILHNLSFISADGETAIPP